MLNTLQPRVSKLVLFAVFAFLLAIVLKLDASFASPAQSREILVAAKTESQKTAGSTAAKDKKAEPKEAPSAAPATSPAAPPETSPAATSEASSTPSAAPSPGGSESMTPGASPTESASASVSPEASPSASAAPAEKAKFDITKYTIPIAGGVGGLIILLIVLRLVLGGRSKSVCERCGKPVLAGMVYCDDCSSSKKPYPGEEKSSPPPLKDREEPRPAPPVSTAEPKKKARPTGRVIATITVRKGANPGYKFSFYESQSQITCGRDPDCDFVIEDDEEVSERHAVISMAEGSSFLIHDMGNTSGLYLNNERVKQSGLKSGDVIRIGKTELTFARL
ncbi:MAG: FHA domain-containing protein [Candidatus Eremiobacteraeota bacterium]|nr:FHA domain-containing protein [Candidatus Eremiobacteraeota bacterium]